MSREWKTENDLCEAFVSAAKESGWDTYPEVEGWDLVLVGPVPQGQVSNRLETGDRNYITIGIQAKLGRSWKVLSQGIKNPHRGPDYRAVLVPRGGDEFSALCRELGLGLYTQEGWWQIRIPSGARFWDPVYPITLPSIPDVGSPGSPAPIQLTPWRERAIVLCRILLLRGYLTGADFDRLNVSRKIWRDRSWIRNDGWIRDGERRVAMYRLGTAPNHLPDSGYDESIRLAVFNSWCIKEPWIKSCVPSPLMV